MKKGKKFLCMLFSVVMLISCMATSVWAAETTTQDGLNAVIQTDKDTYAANEDIQINVTVTNTNAFEVKNVSIENFLPDDLTLKSGSLKSDTVNLKPNETLTLSCVAVLEKSEEPTSSTPNPGDPGTTSSGSTSDEPEDTGSSTKPNESGTISSESNTSEDSSTISSKPMVNPNNPPQTGDNFPIFLSFLILVISAIAIVAIVIAFKKEKKTRKIISLILCCAIGASSITAVGFIRASAEESQSTLSIDKNITIDNKFYNIQCNVIYEDKTTWYQGIDEDHVVNSEKDGSGFDYINNRIVIGFEKESTEEQKQAAVEAVNGVILGISESGTEYQVQIHETENLSELRKICDDVSSMPGVILCFYEKLYELSAVPNDPWKDTTDWDEENPDGLNWWLEAIEAPSAWDYNERFSNIRIGVVDGGFETNHEDLNLTVINPNENITNNKSRDHGTHVAGIIGATANNGIGITGIVWNKDLYCADVPLLTDDKDEQHTSILSTYDGIEQLLKLDCKVINVSLGTTLADDPKAILEEGKTAVYYMCKWKNELNKDDFLIIQSADNNGIDSRRAGSFASITDESIDAYFKEYPGDAQKYSKSDIYQHFMIVGAIEQDGKDYKLCDKDNIMGFLSGFDSNYGDGISIVAPGMDIYSCSEMGGLNGNYVSLFGTSMAAPIVSGVASLVWSINPGFSADEVKEIVCTSTNKNASSSNENDSRESYPIVNAKLAVEEAIRRTDDVASISGTVVDAETGEPLEANISATSEEGITTFATSNPETGDFSIQNLPAGKYTVVISKEGYKNYTFSPTLTDGMIFVLTEPVELEKGLAPTVVGYVSDKTTGEKLEGVTVNAYDQQGYGPWAAATTDATGKFTLTFQDEGAYILKFEKDGYISTSMPAFAGEIEGDDELVPMQVTMEKGNDSGEDKPIIDSGTCGENLTWVLYEDGELVISGTGEMEGYNLDEGLIKYTPWYDLSDKINKVTIKDGITTIGEDAFMYCENLTNVIIPNTVTTIYRGAFSNCDSLPNIVIPYGVKTISYNVFSGCDNLTNIVIPNSVTSIGSETFADCGLTSIVIPDSITTIEYRTFKGCNNLKTVVIPDSVTSISYGAFLKCNSLIDIVIPDSVTSIGSAAFADCGLTSVIIPNSVISIDSHAFSGCGNLTNVIIPDSITTINHGTFEDCDSLTSIDIPDSVRRIENEAFSNCDNLTNIVIPNNLVHISYGAFKDCIGLKEITILNHQCYIFDSETTITGSSDLIIYGYKGSTAEAYATKYGREFVALD